MGAFYFRRAPHARLGGIQRTPLYPRKYNAAVEWTQIFLGNSDSFGFLVTVSKLRNVRLVTLEIRSGVGRAMIYAAPLLFLFSEDNVRTRARINRSKNAR